MSQGLDVIALISGGKDSFFSILHCLANGHRIVALANLYPPPSPPSPSTTESDLNSYMYQTVGHALIPLYATALELPLYRQEIAGSALNSRKDYHPQSLSKSPPSSLGSLTRIDVDSLDDQEIEELSEQLQQVWPNDSLTPREKLAQLNKIWQSHANNALNPVSDSATPTSHYDETESLVPLLRRVLAAHPSANAVCSGAILSTYQRTRIESVAQRLNLIPLSYLWQYSSLPTPFSRQAGLLEDMRAVGLDARIVKVASGGLDEGLLWGNLLDPGTKGRVAKAVGRFGGSMLGEGGEFETLVLDGPAGLWKGRIEVREDERRVGRGEGGEAWVGLKEGAGVVVPKWDEGHEWKERLRKVELWDKQFRDLLAALEDEGRAGKGTGLEEMGPRPSNDQASALTQETEDWHIEWSRTISKSTLKISNMTAASAGNSAEQQMVVINPELLQTLRDNDRQPSDIIFTTLLLRSMSDFSTVNSIYAALFTEPNPPARVTVACGDSLPKDVKIMVSFVVDLGSRQAREGLHVQSRSYWAPANIGPYSQAISVPLELKERASSIYVAGQIPLVPASMEVLREDHDVGESVGVELSLFQKQTCLSLQHLWRIGKVMHVGWWTGAIAFITGDADVRKKAMTAWLAWETVHESSSDLCYKGSANSDDGLDDDGLDAWDKKYGGLGIHAAKEEEEARLPYFEMLSSEPLTPGFFAVQVAGLPRGCAVEWQALGLHLIGTGACLDSSPIDGNPTHTCAVGSGSWRTSMVSVPSMTSDQDLRAKLSKLVVGRETCEKDSASWALHATIYTRKPELVTDLNAQIVPCEGVWGAKGRELAAAVVLVYEEY